MVISTLIKTGIIVAWSTIILMVCFGRYRGAVHGQLQGREQTIHHRGQLSEQFFDQAEQRELTARERTFLQTKREQVRDLLGEYSGKIGNVRSQRQRDRLLYEAEQHLKLKLDQAATRQRSIDGVLGRQGRDRLEKKRELMHRQIVSDGKKKLLFKSRLTKEVLLEKFRDMDADVQVRELFSDEEGRVVEISFSEASIVADEIEGQIEQGVFPEQILGEEVIFPDVFPIETISFQGENVSQARGIQTYAAHRRQDALHQGTPVSVGVIDTGIDPTHPDLQGAIHETIPGRNFLENSAESTDDHAHGTHVAGVIAAQVNGGGLFGVNSAVDLIALKICDAQGLCPTYALVDAIVYAADQGVDVINMSLGGRGDPATSVVCDAVGYAHEQGVIIIAAAANANSDVSRYVPGGCANTITVGAVDSDMRKASFSNYGSGVDVAAPGVGIVSTVPGGSYRSMNGTSMAAPHVAGIVSAVLAVHPHLSTDELIGLLTASGEQVITDPGNEIGLFVSLDRVMESLGIQPQLQGWCDQGAEWEAGVCSNHQGEVNVIESPEYYRLIPGESGTGLALQALPERLTLKAGEVAYVHVSGGDPNMTAQLETPYLGLGQPASSSIRVTEDTAKLLTIEDKTHTEMIGVEETHETDQDVPKHQDGEPFSLLPLFDDDQLQLQGEMDRAVAVRGNEPGEHEFLVYDVQGNKQTISVTVTEQVMYVDEDRRYFFPHTPWYTLENIFLNDAESFLTKRVCYSSSCGRGQHGGGETFGFDVRAAGTGRIGLKLRNKITGGYQYLSLTIVAGDALYTGPGVDPTLPPPNRPDDQLRLSEESVNLNRGQRKKVYVGGGTPPYTQHFACKQALGKSSVESGENQIASVGEGGSLAFNLPTPSLRDRDKAGWSTKRRKVSSRWREHQQSSQGEGRVQSVSEGEKVYYDIFATYDGTCRVTLSDSAGKSKQLTIKVTKTPMMIQPGQELIIETPDRFSIKRMYQSGTAPVTFQSLGDSTWLLSAHHAGTQNIRFELDKYRADTTRNAYNNIFSSLSIFNGAMSSWSLLDIPLGDKEVGTAVPLRVSHQTILLHPGEKGTLFIAGGTPPYTLQHSNESSMVLQATSDIETIGTGHVRLNSSGDQEQITVFGRSVGEQVVTITDALGAEKQVVIKTVTKGYLLDDEVPFVLQGSDEFVVHSVESDDSSVLYVQESIFGAGYQLIPLQTGFVSVQVHLIHVPTQQEISLSYSFDITTPVESLPELPPLTASHDSLSLRVGESLGLRVSQGIPPYLVRAVGNKQSIGFGVDPTERGEDVTLATEELVFSGVGNDASQMMTGSDVLVVDTHSAVVSGSLGATLFQLDTDVSQGTGNHEVQSSSRLFRSLALQPGQAIIRVEDVVGRKVDIPVTVTDQPLEISIGTPLHLTSNERYRIVRVQTSNATLLPVSYLGGGRFEMVPQIHGEVTLWVTIFNEDQQREQRLVYTLSLVNDAGNEELQPAPEETSPPPPNTDNDKVSFEISDEVVDVGQPFTLTLSGGGVAGYEIVFGTTGFAIIGDEGTQEVVTVLYPDGTIDDVGIDDGKLKILPLRPGVSDITVRKGGTTPQSGSSDGSFQMVVEEKRARILHGSQLVLPYHPSYEMLHFTSTNPNVFRVTQTSEGYLMEAGELGEAQALIGFLDTASGHEKSYALTIQVVDELQDIQEVTVYVDPDETYSLFLEDGQEYIIEHNGAIEFYDVPSYLYAKAGGQMVVATNIAQSREQLQLIATPQMMVHGLKILYQSGSDPLQNPTIKIIKDGTTLIIHLVLSHSSSRVEQNLGLATLRKVNQSYTLEGYIEYLFARAMNQIDRVSELGSYARFYDKFRDGGERNLKFALQGSQYVSIDQSSIQFHGESVMLAELGNILYGFLAEHKRIFDNAVSVARNLEYSNYLRYYVEDRVEARTNADENSDFPRYQAGKELYHGVQQGADFQTLITQKIQEALLTSEPLDILEEEVILHACKATYAHQGKLYSCSCYMQFKDAQIDMNDDGLYDKYIVYDSSGSNIDGDLFCK